MCKECKWQERLKTIESMLDDPDYDYSGDLLPAIAEFVSKNQHVTERQWGAVLNVRNGADEARRWRQSRGWE